MDGRARTGRELASHLGVAPSTVSEHVGRLLDAGLITVEAQGRHRYVRLAGPETAQMIEMLCGSTPALALPEPRAPAALRHVRTCYDHLAGRVAVDLRTRLVTVGAVIEHDDHDSLSDGGRELLGSIGVDLARPPSSSRPLVGRCLDWTERRRHLAGTVGAAVLTALRDRRWVADGPRPRSLGFTDTGRAAMAEVFQISA
jgi:DNA-binding transcriptional ArsR family regulator